MQNKPEQSPATNSNINTDKLHQKRKKILSEISALFITLLIIYFFYWLFYGRFHEYTDDAYVSGNIVQLMPQVAGTVIAINADDTQLVQQGQVLVKLDPINTQLALQQAEANLANTVRQVRTLYDNAAETQANANLRQAELKRAQDDLNRRKILLTSHAIAPEDYQHAVIAVNVAEAAWQLAEHQAAAANALVANTQLATYPTVEQAKTKLRMAYLDYERTTLIAPVTGYVAKRSVQLGQRIVPGTALLAIIPLNQLWVDANFREVQLAHIRQGQSVKLTSDLYGSSIVYHGKVEGLSAGTGSVFSLLPPQNATGNWIKIVQRVPVRIALDPKELQENPLRIGLSMRATVNTHKKGPSVAAPNKNQPLYSTSVYEQQNNTAEKLIDQIVKANSSAT